MMICNICGHIEKKIDDFRLLRNITTPDRFELASGLVNEDCYSRQWRECPNCSVAIDVLSNDSHAAIENIRTNYYEVDFKNASISEKYHRIMNLPDVESDNSARAKRILKYVKSYHHSDESISVLDVGAGTGVFLSKLSLMAPSRWKLFGVEPDPNAYRHLCELNGFEAFEGYVDEFIHKKDFHVATLNKVLEHLEKPVNLLSSIYEKLSKEKSVLYVEVPDKLSASLCEESDNILGCLHVNLYDPNSLMAVLDFAGFEVLKLDRILEPSGKLTIFAFAAPKSIIELCGVPHE